jgi:hypothetical protein
MSEPRRQLHLMIEGLAAARREELERIAAAPGTASEIFELTEKNAGEALEKIFAADAVAVWGEV